MPKQPFHREREIGFTARSGRPCRASRPSSPKSRPLTAPAFRPWAGRRTPARRLDAGWIAALCGVVRLKCRDRLERSGGGQREVTLQRLARFGVMTGQGERRRKGRMNILDVIRIDRDRLASPFNRLVIPLQPEIGPRLPAIEMGEPRIVRTRPNRVVKIFKAFVETPEKYVVSARFGGVDVGTGPGRVARPEPKDGALQGVIHSPIWIEGERLGHQFVGPL